MSAEPLFRQAGRMVSPRSLPVSFFPVLELQDHLAKPGFFYMDARYGNSGLHIFTANSHPLSHLPKTPTAGSLSHGLPSNLAHQKGS